MKKAADFVSSFFQRGKNLCESQRL